tara:strand:+ start:469 stop:864 length:396 start_codon:yes stop_codon:yes gene_type:complete
MSKVTEVYIRNGKEHTNDKLSTAVSNLGYEYLMTSFEDLKKTMNGEHPKLIIANPNWKPLGDFFSGIASILHDHEYQGKVRATNLKEGVLNWSDFKRSFYRAFRDYDRDFMEIISSEQVEDYLRRTLGLTE